MLLSCIMALSVPQLSAIPPWRGSGYSCEDPTYLRTIPVSGFYREQTGSTPIYPSPTVVGVRRLAGRLLLLNVPVSCQYCPRGQVIYITQPEWLQILSTPHHVGSRLGYYKTREGEAAFGSDLVLFYNLDSTWCGVKVLHPKIILRQLANLIFGQSPLFSTFSL